MKLHNDIMNILCNVPDEAKDSAVRYAYKLGHKDALHAAAELAMKAESEWLQSSLRAMPPPRDREADRARFPDHRFNAWLDTGISDAGHTVWDQIGDVCSAWAAWQDQEESATEETWKERAYAYRDQIIADHFDRLILQTEVALLRKKVSLLVTAAKQVLSDIDDDGVAERHDMGVLELRQAVAAAKQPEGVSQ